MLNVAVGSKGDIKRLAGRSRFAANSGHAAALSQRPNRNRKCRTGLSAIEPSLRQKNWILKICEQRLAPQTRLAMEHALDFPAIETCEYSRTCVAGITMELKYAPSRVLDRNVASLTTQIFESNDDESILTFEVSDDELERTTGTDGQIITFVYCTHYWTNCNAPE
jgi:hypothetical protein